MGWMTLVAILARAFDALASLITSMKSEKARSRSHRDRAQAQGYRKLEKALGARREAARDNSVADSGILPDNRNRDDGYKRR